MSSNNTKNPIKDFLKECHYKAGNYLYPSIIHKFIKDESDEAISKYLNELIEEEYLGKEWFIKCPKCSRLSTYAYNSLESVPKECSCEHCDYDIYNTSEYLYTVYLVLKTIK